MSGTLHKYLYSHLIIPLSLLLRIKKYFRHENRENKKGNIYVKNFFPNICARYEKKGKLFLNREGNTAQYVTCALHAG
jgi:hypothetical protein